jgi:hypothetical protein
MAKQSVTEILYEKLEELECVRVICSDPAQRFTLRKPIEEAEARLQELSK